MFNATFTLDLDRIAHCSDESLVTHIITETDLNFQTLKTTSFFSLEITFSYILFFSCKSGL